MSEDYTTVRGRVLYLSVGAIQFAAQAKTVWIPRMWIHDEDLAQIPRDAINDQERTIRVAKWKADELGLSAGRIDGAAAADLFGGETA